MRNLKRETQKQKKGIIGLSIIPTPKSKSKPINQQNKTITKII
jgi:hypothetical protein